eukprot:gene18495-40398_t
MTPTASATVPRPPPPVVAFVTRTLPAATPPNGATATATTAALPAATPPNGATATATTAALPAATPPNGATATTTTAALAAGADGGATATAAVWADKLN